MTFTFEEIGNALGVKIPVNGTAEGISTDTRTIKQGDAFIALSGENFNGNNYVKEALEKGASLAVCTDEALRGEKTVIVEDTLAALRNIAGAYRDRFDIKLCAVTGSVGKTTTRGMVNEVVSSKYKTLCTKNNLNNEIGVSKTLLELDCAYEAAVIEMGMNHFGEIERMSLCAKPTVGVITNVGVAHIENLGSREGILKAKLELTAGMKKGFPLILNGDNDLLADYKNGDFQIVRFGIDNKKCEVAVTDILSDVDGSYYTVTAGGKTAKGYVPSPGKHNVLNAVCAVAAGLSIGVDIEDAVSAIREFKVEGRRQKIVRKHGFIFLEDCYNANPDSVAAALDTLKNLDCKRRVAVLGDMLELGQYSEKAHKQSGTLAAQSGVDILYTFGPMSKATSDEARLLGCPESENFDTKEELTKKLAETLREGDAVLFKASRSMKLEDIISSVYDELFCEKEG